MHRVDGVYFVLILLELSSLHPLSHFTLLSYFIEQRGEDTFLPIISYLL